MRVVIATFGTAEAAQTYLDAASSRFHLDPMAISMATVAAFRESHDGHRLVAAWLQNEDESPARNLALEHGATLHAPPAELRGPSGTSAGLAPDEGGGAKGRVPADRRRTPSDRSIPTRAGETGDSVDPAQPLRVHDRDIDPDHR